MKPKGTLSLKEWAVVCEALAAGDQLMILRKGGIGEKRGFEVAGAEFLLYPGFEHQHGAKVRDEHAGHFRAAAAHRPAEGRLRIDLLARVAGSAALTTPGAQANPDVLFERTRDLHVYTSALIAERAAYRPDAPLVAVVLEVRRLTFPLDLPEERRYAGCRSWVDLPEVTYAAGEAVVPADVLAAALERLGALSPQPARA